jgi:hypothetical protein
MWENTDKGDEPSDGYTDYLTDAGFFFLAAIVSIALATVVCLIWRMA